MTFAWRFEPNALGERLQLHYVPPFTPGQIGPYAGYSEAVATHPVVGPIHLRASQILGTRDWRPTFPSARDRRMSFVEHLLDGIGSGFILTGVGYGVALTLDALRRRELLRRQIVARAYASVAFGGILWLASSGLGS